MYYLKINHLSRAFLSIAMIATPIVSIMSLSNPASAQYTCNDVSVGQDTREIQTPNGTKRGSATITGLNCDSANRFQYQDNSNQRATDVMLDMGATQRAIYQQDSQSKVQMMRTLFGNDTPPLQNNPRRCGRSGSNNPGDC